MLLVTLCAFCHVHAGAGNEDVDVGSLLLLGAWQYMFRLSGWERRGRLPGFSSVLTANRHRLMHPHGTSFFHLLSATVRPGVDDAAVYLAAVVQPLCQLVRAVGGLDTLVLHCDTHKLHFIPQADLRGVPCYVEVTQPALVPAYEALGFEAPEPPKELFGVPITPMRRPAAAAAARIAAPTQ